MIVNNHTGRLLFLTMSSDNELRCNNLKCRAQLSMEGKAVVTGCSREFLLV